MHHLPPPPRDMPSRDPAEPLDMPSPARGDWTYTQYVRWPGSRMVMSPVAWAGPKSEA